MKDHQLGFLPAEDDRMLGNSNAECIDDYGVGIPTRVLDEWEARIAAKIAAERARTQLLRERRVNTRCMTDNDVAGIMPKKPAPLSAASLTATMVQFFEAHAKSYEQQQRKAVQPMPIAASAHAHIEQLQLQYTPVTDRWRQIAQAQAQQNQAQDAQNAYTDSLLMPSVQLSQWSAR